MRRLLACLPVLALTACASTPSSVSPLPQAPAAVPVSDAPVPPMAPVPPAELQLSIPEAPEGRRQTVEEVFQEVFSLDAVPASFPFGIDQVIVVTVPEETRVLHRAGLIGAFLASGFPVKDAGTFQVASFHINDRPWWYDRDGFERIKLPEGVELQDLAEMPVQEYDGLSGMEIALMDPTSLWAPDLLANQNLASDFFVRIFELTFDDVESTTRLAQVFDTAKVAAFREDVADINSRIESYNRAVERYLDDAQAYRREFSGYVKRYEKWEADEYREYGRRYDEYTAEWQSWRASNGAAIDQQNAQGTGDSRWSAPEPRAPRVESDGVALEANLPPAEPREALDTVELEAQIADERALEVPCRQLNLLAEVIDARTGNVVWVGHAISVVRAFQTDGYLLRETVRRLTR